MNAKGMQTALGPTGLGVFRAPRESPMRRTRDLTSEQPTTANSASDGAAPEGRMPSGKSMQEGRWTV